MTQISSFSEILHNIFRYVDNPTLCSCRLVSRAFKAIASQIPLRIYGQVDFDDEADACRQRQSRWQHQVTDEVNQTQVCFENFIRLSEHEIQLQNDNPLFRGAHSKPLESVSVDIVALADLDDIQPFLARTDLARMFAKLCGRTVQLVIEKVNYKMQPKELVALLPLQPVCIQVEFTETKTDFPTIRTVDKKTTAAIAAAYQAEQGIVLIPDSLKSVWALAPPYRVRIPATARGFGRFVSGFSSITMLALTLHGGTFDQLGLGALSTIALNVKYLCLSLEADSRLREPGGGLTEFAMFRNLEHLSYFTYELKNNFAIADELLHLLKSFPKLKTINSSFMAPLLLDPGFIRRLDPREFKKLNCLNLKLLGTNIKPMHAIDTVEAYYPRVTKLFLDCNVHLPNLHLEPTQETTKVVSAFAERASTIQQFGYRTIFSFH